MRRHARAVRPRWIFPGFCLLALTARCAGDPYSRYADVIHDNVDAAMVAAFQMTARIQLSVVHNEIPSDSFAVVALVVTRAAHGVRTRADHFAEVTPPPDLVKPHAELSAQLSRLALALDAMGFTFQRCADAAVAGDSVGKACEAHLAALNSRYGYVGEDLRAARNRLQRLLLPHGVLLRPIASQRDRVPPTLVAARSGEIP